MKSFLEYVAEDILEKFGSNLTRIAIVFPNKRASLFLNKYLYETHHRKALENNTSTASDAVWCPQYITISELFQSQSELELADPIRTNCILYKVFCDVMQNTSLSAGTNYEPESLDHFWSWGQMMLADFDDLDKNLGDADIIFNNVRDLEALQASPETYLSPEQKEALMQFFNLVADDKDNSQLRHRFELLWNNLAAIYHALNEEMQNQGITYEGAMYRSVAETATSSELQWKYDKYLFVGFNMTQKSEQTLFQSIKMQDKALFYWDYDTYYRDKEAGRFITRNLLERFPNELAGKSEVFNSFNDTTRPKEVSFLAAATENIQARYINEWLKSGNRLAPGQRTAIVLADESLLKSVIHYLPESASGKVNITVGYPLAQSPATSFVKNFIALHREGYDVNSRYYHLRYVSNILRHPYIHYLSPKASDLLRTLHTDRIFFPEPKELLLDGDEGLKLLFTPYEGNRDGMNEVLLSRLLELLSFIGKACESERIGKLQIEGKSEEDSVPTYEEQFIQESLFQMHSIIMRLHRLVTKFGLTVDISVLLRIFDQIIKTATMPFHGEPAVDLQIMGVLETRNLDFDHVLLLSCNEGNLPKKVNDSSLIPYIVRNAHGLTTIDNKVAIFAYYFYRLLQRCSDVTISYNSSTEDGHTGEMSRFMQQLMVEAKNAHITQHNLVARQIPSRISPQTVVKDEKVMQALGRLHSLSPSAINKYLHCPLQFYYHKLVGLQEDTAEDIIDNRAFGSIFHAAAQIMYDDIKHNGIIEKQAIEHLLSKEGRIKIEQYVDEAFRQEFFNNRKPHYDGMQLINHEVIISFIRQTLEGDLKFAPFQVIGLECDAFENISFTLKDGQTRRLSIGGSIDRLDCVNVDDGHGQKLSVLRVVDYKTGQKMPKVFETVDEVFIPKNVEYKAEYLLQAMLYSIIVRHCDKPFYSYKKGERIENKPLNPHLRPVSPCLMFIQNKESINDPVIKFGDKETPESVIDIKDREEEFRNGLYRLLAEIFDPETPFTPTTNSQRCEKCSFKRICMK